MTLFLIKYPKEFNLIVNNKIFKILERKKMEKENYCCYKPVNNKQIY